MTARLFTPRLLLRATIAAAIALGVGLAALGQGQALAKSRPGAARSVDRLETALFR